MPQLPSTTRSPRIALAAILASVLLAAAPAGASAATVTVKMGYNEFTPAARTVARGDRVRWSNKGGYLDHNVQATAPRWYFYSTKQYVGDIRPEQTFQFTFRSAGLFRYTCSIHSGMDGTISVPISVARLAGPVRFRITVASAASTGAWRNEVQVRKPGASRWKRIALTAGASVSYTPGARGTYGFRSRVTNTTTGADSGWSAVVSRTY